MTDLTEQMHKDELPEGWYYVIKTGDVEMLEYSCNCFLAVDVPLIDNEVTEVLAPVPSFEEWKEKLRALDAAYETIKIEDETINRLVCSGKQCNYENAQLKETNEALKAELKEVCDVLIRKCPEMKEWVMLNWKNLYEVQDE